MKICRIVRALPPVLGGLEQHAAELSAHQAGQGIEVHLVFTQGKAPPFDGIIGHRIEMQSNAAQEKSTRRKLRFMLHAWTTLWRLAKEQRFDVIDVHGDFVEAAFVGMLGKLTATPFVLTVQAGLSERVPARWASRLVFPLVTHFVAVSDAIQAQLVGRGVSLSKISVITNAVDLARFNSCADAPSLTRLMDGLAGAKIVLFTGRLHRLKGLDVLLQAVPLVIERVNNAIFIIAGDGPEESSLKQMAARLPAVRFAGFLQPEEVPALMRLATVFVYPSVPLEGQAEGTPRAILEAMASGLPIVATRTGGIPELVRDGKGGRVVEPRDARTLADAIVEVLSNPTTAMEMGRYNRSVIESRDFGKIERTVTALFEKLVVEHRK